MAPRYNADLSSMSRSHLQQASPAFRRFLFEGKASDLHPKRAITLPESSALSSVIEVLAKHEIGCVPLTKSTSGDIVGIISERDILGAAATHDLSQKLILASTLMSKPAQTLPAYASIARVLYFMVAGGYRHIPLTGALLKSTSGEAKAPVRGIGLVSIKNVASYLYRCLGSKISGATTPTADEIGEDLFELFSSSVRSLSPCKPLTINEASSVQETVALMVSHNTGSVVILRDNGSVSGIFTERDLIARVLGKGSSTSSTAVLEVMTPRPHTLTEESSLALALGLFAEGKYRHLPIVDYEERLLGVLSVKDFIKALTEEVLRELGSP
jgi:CBS domain-containing protein